jgi:hypothetical protein
MKIPAPQNLSITKNHAKPMKSTISLLSCLAFSLWALGAALVLPPSERARTPHRGFSGHYEGVLSSDCIMLTQKYVAGHKLHPFEQKRLEVYIREHDTAWNAYVDQLKGGTNQH